MKVKMIRMYNFYYPRPRHSVNNKDTICLLSEWGITCLSPCFLVAIHDLSLW